MVFFGGISLEIFSALFLPSSASCIKANRLKARVLNQVEMKKRRRKYLAVMYALRILTIIRMWDTALEKGCDHVEN